MSDFKIRPTNEIENITTLITKQQEHIAFLQNQLLKFRTEIGLYEKAVPKKTRIVIQEKLEQRMSDVGDIFK
jgi:hypothetical protein